MKSIFDDVINLPTIGPKKKENLSTLGIETVYDLITYYPFRYEDISEKNIFEIKDQEKVVLKGIVVTNPVLQYFGYKKNSVSFRIKVNQEVIEVRFFNQPYLKQRINLNQEIAIYGKYDLKRKRLSGMKLIMTKDLEDNGLQPVYHVNKQLPQKTLVNCIKIALDNYLSLVKECLPDELIDKYQLLDKQTAISQMHFPTSTNNYLSARRRLVYEEFLLFELKLKELKTQQKHCDYTKSVSYDNHELKKFIKTLPFDLTEDQKKVTNEICKDLMMPFSMNRLLQGDVGSGKTVVSAITMYANKTANKQSALMVPTEILAEQHYENLKSLYQDVDCQIALLTSSTSSSDRKNILESLKNGDIDILVGTHALIQDDVEFDDLTYIVIDEQHRFGVKQRSKLKDKGSQVNVLMMTATPIPRTLAITAYGEMDVSVIKELPKGRMPIETKWIKMQQFKQLLSWTHQILDQKQQIYIVCPLVDESEMINANNAEVLYKDLVDYYGERYNIGLLHGKMKNKDKECIMNQFQNNDIQILVSTTVVEVGVNVPNATVMIIMDADRFGLSQLHQLRGRVGRGNKQSYCYLVADVKNELAKQRMEIMTETTDGFVLSEKDLQMRGPGEFFGHRQSGAPQFKVGDIVEDSDILLAATSDANELVNKDLKNEKYHLLMLELNTKKYLIE